MPSRITVTKATILEGSDATLSARVLLSKNETPLMTTDCDGDITLKVYDITAGGEGRRPDQAIFSKTDIDVLTGGPAGGGAILDTYSTTYWAGKDGTGANFEYQLRYDTTGVTGPYLRGGHRYMCEFSVDASSGTDSDFGTIRWVFVLFVQPLTSV